MHRHGFAFEFDIPDAWEETSENGRLICRGPAGEELQISGRFIRRVDNTAQSKGAQDYDGIQLRREFRSNAIAAMHEAAKHPELQVQGQLVSEQIGPDLERCILSTRTLDGQTIFLQATFISPRGVLLITFEAPNAVSSVDRFMTFLRSVIDARHL